MFSVFWKTVPLASKHSLFLPTGLILRYNYKLDSEADVRVRYKASIWFWRRNCMAENCVDFAKVQLQQSDGNVYIVPPIQSFKAISRTTLAHPLLIRTFDLLMKQGSKRLLVCLRWRAFVVHVEPQVKDNWSISWMNALADCGNVSAVMLRQSSPCHYFWISLQLLLGNISFSYDLSHLCIVLHYIMLLPCIHLRSTMITGLQNSHPNFRCSSS